MHKFLGGTACRPASPRERGGPSATIGSDLCYKDLLKLRIRNLNKNTLLAEAAEVADTSEKRRTGLLGRESLPQGEGLWITPCEAIHTVGMKFSIDVIFLDRKRRVVKVRERMGRLRIAACLRAHSVLELPAGTIAATRTEAGDQLEFERVV